MRTICNQIVVVLLVVWSLPYSWEKKGSCRNVRRRHVLKMACSDGGKIFLPKLMGFDDKDCGGCQGLSTSLMTQGHDCSWNNRCKVDLGGRRMVTACYTKMKSVEVVEGRCIHNGTRIYDLITKKTMSSSSVSQLPRETFIIRSHRKFPWNYSYKQIGSESHQMNFSVQMEDINRRLLLSVVFLDIDLGRDELYVAHKRRVDITKPGDTVPIDIEDLSYIVLGFNSRLNYSNPNTARAKGFVLCLKLVNKNVQPKNSVCDDVINYDKLRFSLVRSKKPPKKCSKRGKKGRRKCNAKSQKG